METPEGFQCRRETRRGRISAEGWTERFSGVKARRYSGRRTSYRGLDSPEADAWAVIIQEWAARESGERDVITGK